MKLLYSICVFILLPCLYACKADASYVFFDQSKNKYPILVLPEKASQEEKNAMEILRKALQASTGKVIQLIQEPLSKDLPQNTVLFYLGDTKFSILNNIEKPASQSFVLVQKKNNLFLVGGSQNGLLFGVYSFIERFLDASKLDERKASFSKQTYIEIPEGIHEMHKPAFAFRQAFFPCSNKEEYQLWHGVHHLENEWGCWGHNLGKLIASGKQVLSPDMFALINGKRNEEQFCFTSTKLFNAIGEALKYKIAEGEIPKYWSISANDNHLICQCANCSKINEASSASVSVVQMINKLAEQFPQFTFVSLAYSTTLLAPSKGNMLPNTAIMLSTIDFPKGIALEKQIGFQKFDQNLNAWQKICKQVMIWDYPIQYTNYFDVFPNLPSLQSDLQYFKKKGIIGVFEQGSGYDYSLFQEWKNYAIAKLLWNPDQDLKAMRKTFFQKFYGPVSGELESFYNGCETQLVQNKKALDIYGNVQMSAQSFLDYNALKNMVSFLNSWSSKNEIQQVDISYNIQKVRTCLDMLLLQYEMMNGIDQNGYAMQVDEQSWSIKPDIFERAKNYKSRCQIMKLFFLMKMKIQSKPFSLISHKI